MGAGVPTDGIRTLPKLGLISPAGSRSLAAYRRTLSALLPGADSRLVEAALPQLDHLLAQEKWWTLVQVLGETIRHLAADGAEGCILTAPALHRFAGEIAAESPIPLLSPVSALARILPRPGRHPPPLGLVAAGLTLHPGPFLRGLSRHTGRLVLLPGAADAALLEGLHELPDREARPALLRVMSRLRAAGAGPLLLALPAADSCLEPADLDLNCHHLVRIHATAAARWMLSPEVPPVRPG